MTQHAYSTTSPLIMFRPARWCFPRTGVDLTKLTGRELDTTVSAMNTDELEAALWERRQATAA